MQVTVRKRGNSASVRIPAPIMGAARLPVDTPVNMREDRGRIVIEPLQDGACDQDLASLLAAITAENLHEAADFGPPVGREAL